MANHPSRNRKNRARRASGGREISVPPGLAFTDLHLSQGPDGVSFDTSALVRLCEANAIDPAIFLETDEDNVAGLIVAWYAAHLAAGGDPDPTADQLIAETLAEGKGGSHEPGRA